MANPTVSVKIKGPCGDEMEFYLLIEKDIIEEIRYYTEGCAITKACGAMTAILSRGKNIEKAMSISAGQVLKKLEGVPEGHRHCAILAVSTLYKAVAEYLCAPKNYARNNAYC